MREDWAAARARGRLAALAYALAAALDLIGTALAEHWKPSLRSTPRERGRRHHAVAERRLDPGPAARGARPAAHARLHAGRGRDARPRARRERRASSASWTRCCSVRCRSPSRIGWCTSAAPRPGPTCRASSTLAARVLPPVPGAVEAARRASRPTTTSPTRCAWATAPSGCGWRSPTPSLFPTLGVTPVLGRLPARRGRGPGRAAQPRPRGMSWFGGDTAVIGRSYYIGGQQRTVIGVMGPEFRFPRDGVTLWITAIIRPEDIVPGPVRDGAGRAAASRRDGMPDLERELAPLARRLPERFGGSPATPTLIAKHRPGGASARGPAGGSRWPARSGSCSGRWRVVLLIACANVANLFLVRARAAAARAGRAPRHRRRPAAALPRADHRGRSSWRCSRARSRMVLAWVSVPLYLRFVPPDVPRIGDVEVRWSTLLFTGVASALAALLCGGAAGAARVGAEPRPAARRQPRVHRAPALGAGRARGGADRARARAAHRLGAAVPQLREDAEGGPGLRHPRHLHLPDRARGRRTSRTPRSFARFHLAFMERLAQPAGRAVGGDRGQRAAQRGPRRTTGSFPPSARARPTAACCWASPRSRATTSRPWASGCSRAGRSPTRTSSPTWGTSSSTARRRTCSGRASRRSAGGSSGRRSRCGRPSSAWWKT